MSSTPANGVLFDILENLDREDVFERPPRIVPLFGWPGGKSRSLETILPLLPYGDAYVEPFGGTGIVLLNRKPSQLNIYNDLHPGLIAFYTCLKDAALLPMLQDRLHYTVYGREEFDWCLSTWQTCTDIIEKAARWLYTVHHSYGSQGQHFGRSCATRQCVLGASNRTMNMVHARLQSVHLESLDAIDCLHKYDDPSTVFYLDPPYYMSRTKHYSFTKPFLPEDHACLLDQIFKCQGWVAVSSNINELYERYPWDNMHVWEVRAQMQGSDTLLTTTTIATSIVGTRSRKEVLYVKHAR